VVEQPPKGIESDPPKNCSTCERAERYCVCEFITPVATKTKLLILQHPQEPGVDIGTAPIIQATFPGTIIRTGLSWPNLKKALGREATPSRWGVLYLGSVRTESLPRDRELFVVDKNGNPRADQDTVLKQLEGIVLLDGTWSQAKTLWWRNAWLLKLTRLVIRTERRSLYDAIRKEPRQGCLSTLETAGETLRILETNQEIIPAIERPLHELVKRLKRHRPPNRRSQNRYFSRRRR
jgi:DTW domain-containing protein YfiP